MTEATLVTSATLKATLIEAAIGRADKMIYIDATLATLLPAFTISNNINNTKHSPPKTHKTTLIAAKKGNNNKQEAIYFAATHIRSERFLNRVI